MKYRGSHGMCKHTFSWLIAGVFAALMTFCFRSVSSAEEAVASDPGDLLQSVLDLHVKNLNKIQRVEGDVVLMAYSRMEHGESIPVHEVTQHVSIRYAWDVPGKRRWSEYRVMECLVDGCVAPPDHPRWISMRDIIDREKHIRLSCPGPLPELTLPGDGQPKKERPPRNRPVISISPLQTEVEASLNLRDEGSSVAIAYDPYSTAFDIRFYFHSGEDIHDVLRRTIDQLHKEAGDYPVTVERLFSGDQELIQAKFACREPAGGESDLVQVFNMRQAGAPVHTEWVFDGTKTLEETAQYTYLAEEDIWFPSAFRHRRWDLDEETGARRLARDLRVRFGIGTRINRPWTRPNLFQLEGLGAQAGDLVIDEIEGKKYRYGKEAGP